MLPHACGFALADQGADTRPIQDYLGHRNSQHTVKYTASNPGAVSAAVAVLRPTVVFSAFGAAPVDRLER